MIDIEFRGLSTTKNHWLYGNYNNINDKCYIFPHNALDSFDDYEVDPATVGQYTGLTDIFNEKIFDGDIIRYKTDALTLSYEYVGIVEWDRVNPSMCIRYQRNSYLEDIEYDFVKCGIASIEVIGNKWDNPSLLKGGEE